MNQQEIDDLEWLRAILEEAVRLGMKHQLPTSQVAGFVFGIGSCDKLLKKRINAACIARFKAENGRHLKIIRSAA